jgi:hypothetical protein
MKHIKLVFISLIFFNTLSAKTDTVHVYTVDELIRSIGSHRILLLEENFYNLSEASPAIKDSLFKASLVSTDSAGNNIYNYTLRIANIQKLSIRGNLNTKSKIVTSDAWSDVIQFSNCSDIYIENIEFGHYLQPGLECSGDVLEFWDSKNVHIENCRLFGCGTRGLVGEFDSLLCINVEIDSCSTGQAMDLYGKNIHFKQCDFHHNRYRYDMKNQLFTHYKNIICIQAHPVIFDECKFRENETFLKDEVRLIAFYGEGSAQLTNCLIERNEVGSLTNDSSKLSIIQCILHDNLFQRTLKK